MSTASELLALQELDLARDHGLLRLQEIEESLEETEELEAAREDMAERTRTVEALRAGQADREYEVEAVRAKATDVEGKLYGGKVTIPKELSDLDADLKSLRLLTAKREDILLALLVEIEEAESQRASSADAYGELESSWRTHHEELIEERDRLRPEVDDLTARRDEAVSVVDSRATALYAVLRERKGGVAVARIERGMCQGCRISLPAAVLQKARGSSGLVQCVSCERILLVN